MTAVVEAPRLVSSDARPTRPEWAVTRRSRPAALAAAAKRSPTIYGESGPWEQEPMDRLRLALTIGTETRLARITEYLGRGAAFVGFGFEYEVQRADYDEDGLSIAEDALRGEGVLTDRTGNGADQALGSHAIENHSAHRVDGGSIGTVGSLPSLELLVGEEAVPVDLAPAFRGTVESYTATSSHPDVVTVALARLPRVADEAASLDAQIGYGIRLRGGRLLLTPFNSYSAHGAEHRRLRVGLRIGMRRHTLARMHIELAAYRMDNGWGQADHGLGLMGALSF